MNNEGFSGVVVCNEDKAIGMLTDRALLRRFVPLNKKPEEVKVGEIMGPLIRVDAEASTKEAAKAIVRNDFTRLGVFEGDKFLGWVTLADLARESSKKNLLDALLSHNEPEARMILCPKCRKAPLEKFVDSKGVVVRWECSNCNYIT
jgi:signal-transduction protein with cAMP-binding, CBS, and nucleotidyltransferase domain